jgi:hypothetical protein
MKTSTPVILANGAGDVTTLHLPQTTGGERRAKSFPSDLLVCTNYTEALPLITWGGLIVVYMEGSGALPCLPWSVPACYRLTLDWAFFLRGLR